MSSKPSPLKSLRCRLGLTFGCTTARGRAVTACVRAVAACAAGPVSPASTRSRTSARRQDGAERTNPHGCSPVESSLNADRSRGRRSRPSNDAKVVVARAEPVTPGTVIPRRLHRTACTELGARPSPPVAVSSSGIARALRRDRGRNAGHPARCGHRVGDTRAERAGIAYPPRTFPCQPRRPRPHPRCAITPISTATVMRISSPRCRTTTSARPKGRGRSGRSTAGRTAPTRATGTRSSRNRVWATAPRRTTPTTSDGPPRGATSTTTATTILRSARRAPP